MVFFDGHMQVPGMGATVNEVVANSGLTWGRNTLMQFLPVQIDGSARDAGNTNFTTTLRPGLLLGKIYATGKYKQWDPAAIDGSQYAQCILLHAQQMTFAGTNADRFTGLCMFGGGIRASGIQLPALTARGINGTTEEYNVRAQLTPHFQLDDDPIGALSGRFNAVMIIAATATLSEVHNGSTVVVRGATGAVTLTLPATPLKGLRYRIVNASAQNLILVAGTADTMVVYNDLTADSVALQTTSELIGGSFEVVGDGTGWIVIPSLWEGQTPTIAT
jgi:hypothetical protein